MTTTPSSSRRGIGWARGRDVRLTLSADYQVSDLTVNDLPVAVTATIVEHAGRRQLQAATLDGVPLAELPCDLGRAEYTVADIAGELASRLAARLPAGVY